MLPCLKGGTPRKDADGGYGIGEPYVETVMVPGERTLNCAMDHLSSQSAMENDLSVKGFGFPVLRESRRSPLDEGYGQGLSSACGRLGMKKLLRYPNRHTPVSETIQIGLPPVDQQHLVARLRPLASERKNRYTAQGQRSSPPDLPRTAAGMQSERDKLHANTLSLVPCPFTSSDITHPCPV